MRALLRRLFGRTAARPAAPVVARLVPAPPAQPQGPLAFARFAEMLDLPEPTPCILLPRELEQDEAAAKLLFDRLDRDRQGPESFPSLSMRVLQLIADGEPEVAELAQLVSRDPALSASVLRVSNSPIYRGLGSSQTVRDALARLGSKEVARIAGVVSARSLFHPRARSERAAVAPLLTELYEHATATAAGAAWLAMQRPGARSDRAWLGGLLHDVGKALALRALGALAAEGKAPPPARDLRTARLLHQVHGRIGAELAARWSLPAFVGQICGQHHDANPPAGPDSAELHVVRLVSALRLYRANPAQHPQAAGEIPQSAWALGIDPRRLRSMEGELTALAKRGRVL